MTTKEDFIVTDRRQREPVKCQESGCVHLGHWDGYCPLHRRDRDRP